MKVVIGWGISGCARKDLLDATVQCAAERGKRLKVYHVGELMFEQAEKIGFKLNRENILNADPDILLVLRSTVLNGILEELHYAGDQYDAVLISVHAFFYWDKIFRRAYDKFLNRFPIDMHLTFIDDFRHVMPRLNAERQWASQKLKPAEILAWQNVEVEATAALAEFADKPFFVVPTTQSPHSVYQLIFEPEVEPIYVAMPISHLREPESREAIDRIIARLHRRFVVFDPLSVEVVGAFFVDKQKKNLNEELVVYHHIVHRDLYWFVRQARTIVVIWPKSVPPKAARKWGKALEKLWPKAVPSPGANHETHEAFIKTKNVWTLFLGPEASPFIAHYTTRLFLGERQFFRFLNKHCPERK